MMTPSFMMAMRSPMDGLVQIMGDEDGGFAKRLRQLAELVLKLAADQGSSAENGLVHQDDSGSAVSARQGRRVAACRPTALTGKRIAQSVSPTLASAALAARCLSSLATPCTSSPKAAFWSDVPFAAAGPRFERPCRYGGRGFRAGVAASIVANVAAPDQNPPRLGSSAGSKAGSASTYLSPTGP